MAKVKLQSVRCCEDKKDWKKWDAKEICLSPRKVIFFPHFLLQHANQCAELKELPSSSDQVIKIPSNQITNPILTNK